TLSLPTAELVDDRASDSDTAPSFNWFFRSARAVRASAALASAAARCSGESCGGVAMRITRVPGRARRASLSAGPVGAADELGDRRDAPLLAPAADSREHVPGGARIGEGGRADLHGAGAGEDQLDGLPGAADTAHADDVQRGQRGVDVEHGA